MNRRLSHYKTKNCITCGLELKDVYCNIKRCFKCTEKIRFSGFRRYGVTPDEFKSMLEIQNNNCAICKTNLKLGSNSTSIDHNHSTNKVRGVLCRNCNLGLGYFKDNVEYFQNAINYLKRSCE